MNFSAFLRCALSALGFLLLAARGSSHADVVSAVTTTSQAHRIAISPLQDRERVLEFWTTEHMKSAEVSSAMPGAPVGKPLLPGADVYGFRGMPAPYVHHPVSRLTGMLFYRQPGTDSLAHCTASVITSRSRSLIVTAGHCVAAQNGWKDMIAFVPAYDGTQPVAGRTPLGVWPIAQAFLPYVGAGNDVNDDVAVARLYPDRGQRPIEAVVGHAFMPWISETDTPHAAWTLGYPGLEMADPPYGKGLLFECYTFVTPMPGNPPPATRYATPYCATQSGTSGGPLITDRSQAAKVLGVVHDTTTHTRLRPSTFGLIYPFADAASPANARTSPHETTGHSSLDASGIPDTVATRVYGKAGYVLPPCLHPRACAKS